MTVRGDRDKEISREQAKNKDLETQLSQLRYGNTQTQDQAKKIADLENKASTARSVMSQAQSARDRDANAARARITSLENQLRAKTKEVDDQKVCVSILFAALCSYVEHVLQVTCSTSSLNSSTILQGDADFETARGREREETKTRR